MKVVINDANILIDVVELKILPGFFSLDMEFLTNYLILNELFESQQRAFNPFIDNGSLQVEQLTPDALKNIKQIQRSRPQLSEQDCSAFHQAQKTGGILLTSDHNLRKFAKEKTIEVHGHLWIFDKMVATKTILPEQAIKKLSELTSAINPKLGLPEKECQNRIKKWKAIF